MGLYCCGPTVNNRMNNCWIQKKNSETPVYWCLFPDSHKGMYKTFIERFLQSPGTSKYRVNNVNVCSVRGTGVWVTLFCRSFIKSRRFSVDKEEYFKGWFVFRGFDKLIEEVCEICQKHLITSVLFIVWIN